jgi:hypothetical protein
LGKRISLAKVGPGDSTERPADHAAERWARAVAAALDSTIDPKTLQAWGRAIGAARGTLRVWCRAARLSAKSSLDFTRLLRAVRCSQGLSWDPNNLLDVVDERTLHRLLQMGGLEAHPLGGPAPDCQFFIESQRLVRNPAALRAVLAALEIRDGSQGNVGPGPVLERPPHPVRARRSPRSNGPPFRR